MARRPKGVNYKAASSGMIVQRVIDADKSGYLAGTPLANETESGFLMAGQYILAEQNRRNAFVNTLMNKIFMQVIQTVAFYSEWERYTEKGILEYGETIEEIYVGLVKSEHYEWTTDVNETVKKLFSKRPQEIASAYHAINFEEMYPVTITRTELRKAFMSSSKMEDFIRAKTEAAYTSYRYDNYLMCKYMLYRLALNGMIQNNEIPAISKQTADDAVIAIKAAILDSQNIRTTNTLSKLPQSMQRRKAVVIRNTTFGATIDVASLAQAFNLQYAEYADRQLTIDGFSAEENERISHILNHDEVNNPGYQAFTQEELDMIPLIDAFVVDEDFFLNYMYLFEMDNAYDGAERYWNYFLHVWKIFSVSPFKTVYMFTHSGGEINGLTISPMATTLGAGASQAFTAEIAYTGFIDQSVTWSITGANVTTGADPTYIDMYGNLHIGKAETSTAITVKAESVADPTKTATANVTVVPVPQGRMAKKEI